MKVGTFVAQEHLPISESEIKELRENIEFLIRKYFPNYSFEGNVEVEHNDRHTYIRYKGLFSKGVTYRTMTAGDNWFVKRGDLIMPYGNLVFMVSKEKGYDEAKVGKSYEWKDGFKPEFDCEGYSAYLIWSGLHKEKGHRHVSGLSVDEHFQYGTEISDLDFSHAMHAINNICNYAKVEKKIDLQKMA